MDVRLTAKKWEANGQVYSGQQRAIAFAESGRVRRQRLAITNRVQDRWKAAATVLNRRKLLVIKHNANLCVIVESLKSLLAAKGRAEDSHSGCSFESKTRFNCWTPTLSRSLHDCFLKN